MDDRKLTAKYPSCSDETGSWLDKAGLDPACLSFPPLYSPSPIPWLKRKCPSPTSTPVTKQLPFCLPKFYPGHPLLLPPPCLLPYGAQPSVQGRYLFMVPQGTSYPPMAVPSLLTTANEPGYHSSQQGTLSPCLRVFQTSGQARPSRSPNRNFRASLPTYCPGLEHAGVACLAKRLPLSSRAGTAALPYPLKKENGKILYQCNVCSKSFGQLSNLKVPAPQAL